MQCPNCGSKDEQERFCNQCGQVLRGEPEVSPYTEVVPTDERVDDSSLHPHTYEEQNDSLATHSKLEEGNQESQQMPRRDVSGESREVADQGTPQGAHQNAHGIPSEETNQVVNKAPNHETYEQSWEGQSNGSYGQPYDESYSQSYGQPYRQSYNGAPHPIYNRKDSGWIAFLIIACIVALSVLAVFMER